MFFTETIYALTGVALFGLGLRGSLLRRSLLGRILAINICGAGTVVVWLLSVPRDFSVAGRITLSVVAVLVLGIGFVELFHRLRR